MQVQTFLGGSTEASTTKSCWALLSPFIIWSLRKAVRPIDNLYSATGQDSSGQEVIKKEAIDSLHWLKKPCPMYEWVLGVLLGCFASHHQQNQITGMKPFITESSSHRTIFLRSSYFLTNKKKMALAISSLPSDRGKVKAPPTACNWSLSEFPAMKNTEILSTAEMWGDSPIYKAWLTQWMINASKQWDRIPRFTGKQAE